MSQDFTFSLNSITFDESYQPLDGTRLTTNFANLARGEGRQQNLCIFRPIMNTNSDST
ncbi:putative oxygenase MesX [Aeromonas caviae]|uniref:putative oxygenase MesX n=1 Tax=Aeromonas caviae TaxID=648 RepID=UPI0038D1694E